MSRTSVRSEQVRDQAILVDDLRDFAVILATGLDVTVKAGRVRNDNATTDQNAQTVTLTNNTTNYVEINTSGVAFSNTTGFTAGRIPLATVVTSSGSVTTITDKRTWVIVDNNSGGGSTPPGTLSDTTKDLWIALAETKIIEDQTANRVANEVGSMRVDVFTDGSGIDSGLSVDYTRRDTPNYDVIVTPTSLSLFRPSDIPTNLQAFWKLGSASKFFLAVAGGSIDTSIKKFGNGSYNNNDAGNNYLGWGNRTDLATAFLSDWTVELWVYFDNVNNNDQFLTMSTINPANDTGFQGTSRISIGKGTNAKIEASWQVNGVSQGSIQHQTTLSNSTWYHVAFVKSGSTETIYVDGVASDTTLSSAAVPTNITTIIFGTNNSSSGGDHLDGRVDEFRISNVARYTTGFTPASSAFTADSNTRSLIHFDSSTWVDDGMPDYLEKDYSTNGNHLSNTNTVVSSTEDYWNSGEDSGDFEASNSEYLSITDAAQTGLDLTGSYTVSMWIKIESLGTARYLYAKPGSPNGYGAFVNGTGQITAQNGAGSNVSGVNGAVSAGKWHHLVIVYTGSFMIFYLDGRVDAVNSYTTNPVNSSADFFLGESGSVNYFDGLMKDAAIWSTALTPLQVKSLTLGLDLSAFSFRPDSSSLTAPTAYWKLNEASSGAGAISRADSAGSHTLTDNNTVGTLGGFIEALGADFEGSNSESLSTADSADWAFGTGNLTISFWMKPESIVSGTAIISQTNTSGSTNERWGISYSASNVRFYNITGGTPTIDVDKATTIVAGTWYHIAVTRTGNDFKIYVDGKQIGTTVTDSDSMSDFTGSLFLGKLDVAGSEGYFDGILSDFAIWKGTALTDAEVASLACGLPIQEQGLISYWKLNEASGNATDEISGNTLTENGTGGVGSAAGKVGNARDFERADVDYLSIADASQTGLDLIKDFTVLYWVNLETANGTIAQVAMDKAGFSGAGYGIRTSSADQIAFSINSNSLGGTTVLAPATWYHIVGTYDGANRRIYVNSKQDASGAFSTNPVGTSDPFRLGSHSNETTTSLDGLLDEAVVSARWFRDEEIKTSYNKGLNGKEITSSEITPNTTATVISTAFSVSTTPDRALLIVNEVLNAGTITYYVSRVSSPGTNLADTTKWTPITPNSITDISGQNSGTSCRWAAVLEDDAELDDVAVVFGTIGGSGGGSGSSSADLGLLFSLMGA